jgi:uncharacterized protein
MTLGHAAHLASALCVPGHADAALGVAGILCAAALFGGFAHCAAMCGPFVLMQLEPGAPMLHRLARLRRTALPGYQLGRMTTYMLLGAAAGGLGASLVELTAFRRLFAVLLGAAALCFLLQAVARSGLVPRFGAGAKIGERWGVAVARLAGPLL